MLLLPTCLKEVSRITAENARYSMANVKVIESDDPSACKRYTVQATDGRRAVIVTGLSDTAAVYPTIPQLTSAPNSATEGLIPAADWQRAFKSAPKGKIVSRNPYLANVACVLGTLPGTPADEATGASETGPRHLATLGTTDNVSANVTQATGPEVGTRFAPIESVLPTGTPTARFAVDPELLAGLLQVARACGTDEENKRVTFEVYGGTNGKLSDKPLVIRAKTADREFTGAIMPIA